MPKVSVIMPSLNVAMYIRECMESVLNQSFGDFEILAIDAGSEDGTFEILREYEAKDSRVHVILSEKRSYGYQMNLGMDSAKGEYIYFLETDDLLFGDVLECFSKYLDTYDIDFVKGYAYEFIDLPNGSRYCVAIDKNPKANGRKECFLQPNHLPSLLMSEYHLWVGLYRTSFLRGIRFNETPGAAFQDIGFIIQSIMKSAHAMYVDVPVYLYRFNNTNSSVYNRNGIQYCANEYSIAESLFTEKDDIWCGFFYSRMFMQCLARFRTMALSGSYWTDTKKELEFFQNRLCIAKNAGCIGLRTLSKLEYALLKLFLISEKMIYEFFYEEYQLKIAQVNHLLSHLSDGPIMIWGCGEFGKYIHAILCICGEEHVVAFVDTNVSLQGKTVQGIKVLSPHEAKLRQPHPFFIIASKRYSDDIRCELLTAEIPESNIYYQDMEIDDMILSHLFFQYRKDHNDCESEMKVTAH